MVVLGELDSWSPSRLGIPRRQSGNTKGSYDLDLEFTHSPFFYVLLASKSLRAVLIQEEGKYPHHSVRGLTENLPPSLTFQAHLPLSRCPMLHVSPQALLHGISELLFLTTDLTMWSSCPLPTCIHTCAHEHRHSQTYSSSVLKDAYTPWHTCSVNSSWPAPSLLFYSFPLIFCSPS